MPATSEISEIPIAVKKDFLQRISSTGSVKALSEMIWNSVDAGADLVDVIFTLNKLEAVEEIHVKDDGVGIDYDEVMVLFGNLGDSWKKRRGRFRGRALHGKNGQGRLYAFSLGNRVQWKTTWKKDGSFGQYSIRGRADALDNLELTEPKVVATGGTGTTVVISGIDKGLGNLTSDDAPKEFAKLFAAYLSQYPNVTIRLNGTALDPAELQLRKEESLLDDILLKSGKKTSAHVTIVEWNTLTPRAIYLCDSSGVALHETDAGIQAPGFRFSAYVKCDHFRELDKENLLSLDDLHPDVSSILSAARNEMRQYFRKRAAERASTVVQRWKDERIYPYEDKPELTPTEDTERQVFDILAVNLEEYLPQFEGADTNSRKFTFLLLAQALRDNPRSVQRIVTNVLQLKLEEQEELSALLDSTPLSSIISSASTVANRLDFLVALENLLFDKEPKKKLLERDQLHKILESEAWVFDEEFALSGTEQRLEEVLDLHLHLLGDRSDDDADVLREKGQQGRIDLMLSRVVQPRDDEHDHLVVELKRPSQKITSSVLSQVESYAIAVAEDPRFNKEKTRWKFIAVSNEFDEHAKRKACQKDKPKGLVFDDGAYNIQVWAFTWTEIISQARSRLQFINHTLDYTATRESSREYLEKAHAKFIPIFDDETEPSE